MTYVQPRGVLFLHLNAQKLDQHYVQRPTVHITLLFLPTYHILPLPENSIYYIQKCTLATLSEFNSQTLNVSYGLKVI